jgi:hypothetical protein
LTDRAFQKEGFIERVDIASFAAWWKSRKIRAFVRSLALPAPRGEWGNS